MTRYFLLICGLAGAVLFSQVPAFHQQYIQRLGGHIAEIDAQVTALDERAARVDKDRFTYIRDFMANPDASVRSEGEYLAGLLSRQVALKQSRDRLTNMSWIYVGAAMAYEGDPDILKGTFDDFQPGVSFTLHGIGYVVAGFLTFYFLVIGLMALFTWRKVPADPYPNRV